VNFQRDCLIPVTFVGLRILNSMRYSQKRFDIQMALVIGGSSGIGLAVARMLAARGAHVWLMARDETKLAEALRSVEAAYSDGGQRCGTVMADVSDQKQVQRAVDGVTKLR
jgi:NAD(P)-dependent dehydrogenase (short-subunit alcohol dehydrogenase family)